MNTKTQEVLERLERLGNDNDRLQSERAKKYLNITKDTGEFLSVLVKATNAQRILEIGTSNGYSTIWLASSIANTGMVHTIEVNPLKIEEARDNFEQAQVLENITQWSGDVCEVLKQTPEQVDFIFLDADRSKYLSIAESLFSRLKSGGLLVCDNAISHASELEAFAAWVKRQSNLTTSLVSVGKGELLVLKR
ncbi:O-methyltransferase [Vibrio barjaei]|uniref:O-methyltransferase n=2 Tax=Gammaproteobacteria TaxID=1236 RepID=A0ABW7IR83_9VIBR